jgi:hypothetical protein
VFIAASRVCKYDGLFVYICTTEVKKKNATNNQWKIRMQQRSGFCFKNHANEEACVILFFTQCCRLPEMMIFALFSFRGAR